MRLWTDGSTTRVCYKFEDYEPIIINLLKKMTSNEGEYQAIIYALEAAIRLRWKDITVLSDSQLVVRQLNGKYAIKKKHLAKLAAQVWKLRQQLDSVEFCWIKRDKNEAGIALEENQ